MIKHIEILQANNNKKPPKYPYLDKSYLDNQPETTLLSTPLGKYTNQQSTTSQSANTNRTRMEHISFPVIPVGCK